MKMIERIAISSLVIHSRNMLTMIDLQPRGWLPGY